MRNKANNSLLLISVVVAVLLFIYIGYIFVSFLIFFIYSLYKLYPEKYLLIKIIKSTFTIKFYNLVIWFISYILALKFLNVFFGINEEYLKFSPAIIAIPVSICVLYLLLMVITSIFSVTCFITNHCADYLPKYSKVDYEQFIFFRLSTLFQSLTVVALIPLFLAILSLIYSPKIVILSDASFISDCGVKQWGVMYLRKNNNECYKFTLNSTLFSEPLLTIPSKK
ncbi:MAG: hypothetical protein PV362_17245 [Providencia heimbachae]|nr:hypothetical protein [Providencia heimbachae]